MPDNCNCLRAEKTFLRVNGVFEAGIFVWWKFEEFLWILNKLIKKKLKSFIRFLMFQTLTVFKKNHSCFSHQIYLFFCKLQHSNSANTSGKWHNFYNLSHSIQEFDEFFYYVINTTRDSCHSHDLGRRREKLSSNGSRKQIVRP